ncbi:MAG: cysteine desulfurase family protein [Armatimonadota bacterium]
MNTGASIYLDYAATTPLDPRVEEAMRPFGRATFGNPSSLHAFGREARAALDTARDRIADLLGARAEEIIFTSGGTEADNLAVKGVARALKGRGAHIVTTAFEHHAVLEACQALEAEGFTISYLKPNADGLISPADVEQAITSETVLVSVMYANNEVGTVQPIAEIGRICRMLRVPFHTDAVQAAGELPMNVRDLQVDLMTLSAHKVYGPKGAGALYLRAGTRLRPLIDGGGQEHERRAGTENVAGLVGFATALEHAHTPAETARIIALREMLIDGLLQIPDSRLHGSRIQRLANNVNVGFAGVPGETLLLALDLAGIAVSTGAACAAGAVEPSHVLQSMGYSRIRAQEALRLTLGRYTTEAEIRAAIDAVAAQVIRLRRHPAPPPPLQDECPS